MGFTLYDPNMNELEFPVGVKPLDFLVSSISKERTTEKVEGIPGQIDYGFNYSEREASMTFWLRHYHAEHDFLLLVSELNDFLDSQPFFYVAHNYLPTRVMKVTVDESYQPDRILGSMYAKLEVKCNISGLPFWRTKYTTQDIDTSGYTALVEKYGMADGFNIDYPSYTFTSNEFYLWNGGNVEIDPRNMPLKIIIENVTSSGNFSIESFTNGDKFVYKEPLNNQTLVLDGAKTLIGVNNMKRNTNRGLLRIRKHRNLINIKNGTFSKIRFEFPFFYK